MTKISSKPCNGAESVTLIVHRTRTPEDKTAETLVTAEFNGRTAIAERLRADGEVLPSLWIGDLRLNGLKRIRDFITSCSAVVEAR